MNMNQFTQKTIEAIQRAQQIAVEYGHQSVDQEHVMLALTEDTAALIRFLETAPTPQREKRNLLLAYGRKRVNYEL